MSAFESRQRFGALDGVKRHWSLRTEEIRPVMLTSSNTALPLRNDFLPDSVHSIASPYNVGEYGRMFQYGPAQQTDFADPLGRHRPNYRTETLVMPRLLEGGKIGLAIDQLEVNEVLDPMAASCGFRVGDRFLAVNGVAVSTQDEFRVALQYAIREYQTRGTALKFQVQTLARSAHCCEGGPIIPVSPSRRRNDSCDFCYGPEEDCIAYERQRNEYFRNDPSYRSATMPAEMTYRMDPIYNPPVIADTMQGYPGDMDRHGYSRKSRDTWAC